MLYLTGVTGQLGSDLRSILDSIGMEYFAPAEHELDICNSSLVEASFSQCEKRGRISAVIHGAAFTQVDACEAEREKAFLINAAATENIARICGAKDLPMVYVSTDFVFDGLKTTPYEVDEPAAPCNVYGESKLAGETAVRKFASRHYITRTAWLYGVNGNNFPRAILKKAASGEKLSVVNDQFGSPTYSRDLAEILLTLLGISVPLTGVKSSRTDSRPAPFGTYHTTNFGYCSWFDFACEIARQGGWNTEIKPIASSDLDRAAKRPAFSVMSPASLTELGLEMRPWQDALGAFMQELKPKSPELFNS